MSLRRSEKRNIYFTYYEIRVWAESTKSLSCSQAYESCARSTSGMSPWVEASFDFFGLAGDDLPILHKLYYCSEDDTHRQHSKTEKQVSRRFWQQVQERALDEYAELIAEKM